MLAGSVETSSYLVGFHWNDCAEGVAEGVDVLHVEVVGGDGVGDRVVGQVLRLLGSHPAHFLGIELDGIVP